jgi:hypothetical protein
MLQPFGRKELAAMSEAETDRPSAEDWPPINPWHLIAGAGVAGVLAFVLASWTPFAILPILAGLIAAGSAVALRPKSPALLAAAGVLAFVFYFAMDRDWDSARMVVRLLGIIALLAAALVALPTFLGQVFAAGGASEKEAEQLQERGRWFGRMFNRIVVSFLVLIHFTGIVCAVMSVPPPGRDQSWLAQWGWSVMQPYLQFAYLINAYHFYAPEPGPPSLLWFYVEYSDGSGRLILLPKLEDHDIDPFGQEYTRRLSIGESVNQPGPNMGISDDIRTRREIGTREGFPLHPGMPYETQYRVPAEHSKRLLCEYARFVAQHYPSEKDAGAEPVRVKIYRVIHRILDPNEMAGEEEYPEPAAEWTYLPFYQGEFVKAPPERAPAPIEGTKPDPLRVWAPTDPPAWVLKDPNDPMLYWLVPIYRELREVIDPTNPQRRTGERGWVTVNILRQHAKAGSTKGDQKP